MHALFNTKNAALQTVVRNPEWQYVRDGLKRNLGAVLSYYRKNPMAVKSDHFLVTLLQSISIPKSHNLQRYYDLVDAMSLNLSMALKMTSSIYRGQLFDGVFYGEGSPEILIAHNEDFNVEMAHRDWQNLCAVQVLRHPRSDLAMNLPNGENTGVESGLSVIAINIPMLAIQYRAFRLQEIALTQTTEESQRSTMQFVHMYVLPNMLVSATDMALFNRLNNLHKGAPLGSSKRAHSFYLTDYSKRVDVLMPEVMDALQKQNRDFFGMLRNLPSAFKTDMEAVMRLPEMAPTMQVDWALTISRLPQLAFLFEVSKGSQSARSQHLINPILRQILHYKSNNTFRTMLPVDVRLDIEKEIAAIVQHS